jgi:hypothetical protein
MNWVIQHDFIMNPEYQIYKNVASQNCRKKGVHLVSRNVSGSSESYIIIGSSPTDQYKLIDQQKNTRITNNIHWLWFYDYTQNAIELF